MLHLFIGQKNESYEDLTLKLRTQSLENALILNSANLARIGYKLGFKQAPNY